ncbi:hypothetical protein G3O08_00470 [Cryomorpha ignava]|uniref:Class I SAM-dependent methyltransferase n=1 Tax=Cryomorpha ignava TaxID=101383 RepID=A0A7K3WK07_9FLAO|nr:hypothetical protein [Cryomorpha ignava]NEN21977.1 hypothetical protein [Cryomorpha ignava]
MQNNIAKKRSLSLELEDQSWFPTSLRAYQTDFLGAIAKLLGIYKPAKAFLKQRINTNDQLVDLASGSGIPALITAPNTDVSLTLCDKFPNPKNIGFVNSESKGTYLSKSVDIINDQLPKADIYLMFNGLHHFDQTEIISILKKIKSTHSRAYFFEPITPHFFTFLKVGIATLLLPFCTAPFTKPFRWDRLLFTYLIPVGVLATFWDGMVSVQKSYSVEKLEGLKEACAENGLDISVGILRGRFTSVTYLEYLS